MTRMKSLAALAAMILMLSSCGKDVVIDVGALPTGNAAGAAATGVFSYNEVITDSTCPASASGISLPGLESSWSTTATLLQDDGYLKLDFAATTSPVHGAHAFEGGLYWHGNFRVGGTYFYPTHPRESSVVFINLMDGRFVDGVNTFEGTTNVRVQATDDTDCELKISFTGSR